MGEEKWKFIQNGYYVLSAGRKRTIRLEKIRLNLIRVVIFLILKNGESKKSYQIIENLIALLIS